MNYQAVESCALAITELWKCLVVGFQYNALSICHKTC